MKFHTWSTRNEPILILVAGIITTYQNSFLRIPTLLVLFSIENSTRHIVFGRIPVRQVILRHYSGWTLCRRPKGATGVPIESSCKTHYGVLPFIKPSVVHRYRRTAPNLLTCNSTGQFLTAFTPLRLQEKGLLPKMLKDGSQTIVELTCFETTPSQWTSFEETILAVQVVDEFNEFTSEILELYHDGIPRFISKLETGFLKISIEIHGTWLLLFTHLG